MPALNMLIKPASDNCNLRCKYCFYHDVSEKRSQKSYGMMSYDTLETIVKKSAEYAEGICNFSFQGGEPTLRGLDFFKKLIELQKKYIHGIQVNNSIQTNGTLVDDEWARFFAENKFLVGLSLDGVECVHNKYRKDANGSGTFEKVFNAARLMDKYGADYNILFVVTHDTVKHVKEIYRFYRESGFKFIQPIPCLDPFGEEDGGNPYSLSSDDYAIFLKEIFDLWYDDMMRGQITVIRNFDNYIGILAGFRPEMCSMSGRCVCQFVIEADGGVYPCDFYVLDEWKLGNINSDSLHKMENCEVAKKFVSVSEYKNDECKQCQYKYLCRGGCRRNREPLVNGNPSLNIYCNAYREFFRYAERRLKIITETLLTSRL